MLALDGGGIRGLITLGILSKLEALIAEKKKQSLYQYFDYIAGTSTGAIIAAGLASGMSTADLIKFYQDNGENMFKRSRLLQRFKYFYTADPLKLQLQTVFGADTSLLPGSDPKQQGLKSLLLVVTKNVTTDSPWPISSNPDAKYNGFDRMDCNLKIPLWQLVRASTAAPAYFPAETMEWQKGNPDKTFVFVDGGVTPFNNPAFLLYRMATEPMYRLSWPTGEKNLLLVSIGTGAAESMGATAAAPNRNLLTIAKDIPGELMYGILVDQDINCRTVGRCTYGAHLDREILDLVPRQLTDQQRDTMKIEDQYKAPLVPLSTDMGRRFLYARYNADLSEDGLKRLGFPEVDPEEIQKMDAVKNIPTLLGIGENAGECVAAEHFGSFI